MYLDAIRRYSRRRQTSFFISRPQEYPPPRRLTFSSPVWRRQCAALIESSNVKVFSLPCDPLSLSTCLPFHVALLTPSGPLPTPRQRTQPRRFILNEISRRNSPNACTSPIVLSNGFGVSRSAIVSIVCWACVAIVLRSHMNYRDYDWVRESWWCSGYSGWLMIRRCVEEGGRIGSVTRASEFKRTFLRLEWDIEDCWRRRVFLWEILSLINLQFLEYCVRLLSNNIR